jgi:hypothetical protein
MVNFDLNNDGNSRTDRTPGLGRDTFYLPNFVSLDPRITKSFPITERVTVHLIAEAYNSFNRVNYTSLSTAEFNASTNPSVCGSTVNPKLCLVPIPTTKAQFQSPLSTSLNFSPGSRIVQLSGKITF